MTCDLLGVPFRVSWLDRTRGSSGWAASWVQVAALVIEKKLVDCWRGTQTPGHFFESRSYLSLSVFFLVLPLNNPFSEKYISRRKKVRLFKMKHISTLDAGGKCKMWRSLLAFVIDPVTFFGMAVTSVE